jgi:hypothetical protein
LTTKRITRERVTASKAARAVVLLEVLRTLIGYAETINGDKRMRKSSAMEAKDWLC